MKHMAKGARNLPQTMHVNLSISLEETYRLLIRRLSHPYLRQAAVEKELTEASFGADLQIEVVLV
jgi:hypothetical protein